MGLRLCNLSQWVVCWGEKGETHVSPFLLVEGKQAFLTFYLTPSIIQFFLRF